MVMHEHEAGTGDPQYWVVAKVCEPDYDAELRYLDMELAFVGRKLAKRHHGWPSLPNLGFFTHHDWKDYEHRLKKYAHQLDAYAEDVEDGWLPVKFAVYNASGAPDHQIKVKVKVAAGTVSQSRQLPDRPDRLDAGSRPWLKLKLPPFNGFSRRNIKITPHGVAAEFSQLHKGDGATLVNQIVHVHCGPDTHVTYELQSRNVAHETGDVELQTATEPE